MPLSAIDPTKPILGYSLKQRIGAGGYGEVWAAEAPGGLPKAVKFVYGFHDDRRAQTELKSLNRIRAVRHPFLLSLERIDVVDGQLVVISELADMCLKSRFDLCCESGLKGIPRSELLSYLREAASALDFISDEFRLQHLDVKPENLLLVSEHIKVADFGLVKDIHDGTQSMMSGLTPAYAPPELFDGRPSKASDQYSLAIVFQEMLTGVRPFDGSTAVQLASQHMKERPNLKPLPREDQSTISRAMSKDPELRFPSCSALIDALTAEKTSQIAMKPRTRKKLRNTKQRQRRRPSESTMTLSCSTQELEKAVVKPLSTLDYDPAEAKFRPTLFLGIGKTGTKIARQIRRRLNERDGNPEKLPAIKLLCIDSDASGLASACDRSSDGLRSNEIFQVPLRRPEEYREDARMHLAWLSRRWIYNVPKSLKTEGIRPLGRLALATHVDDLAVRLRQVISELMQAEHLATTADTLELTPLKQPRVVVVGSISGGTCSGMGIDIAYMVRDVLRQLSVEGEDVLGVFTHSTMIRQQTRELSIANSLAFLNELYHFSCVEEYPGDESCGIPPSDDGTTTFASTYFLKLGDDLTDDDYAERIESVAEYLYQGTATRSASYFDLCRRNENESRGLPVRTMGISVSGNADIIAKSAKMLTSCVIRDWTSDASRAVFDASLEAERLLKSFQLTVEQLVPLVHQTTGHVLKDPLQTISRALVGQIDAENLQQSGPRVLEAINNFFAFENKEQQTPLSKTVTALCEQFAGEVVPNLTESIMELADRPGPRLAAASRVARELSQKLAAQRQQLEMYVESTRERQTAECLDLLSSESRSEDLAVKAEKLAKTLLQRFSLESVLALVKAVMPVAGMVSNEVSELKQTFSQAIEYLDDTISDEALDPPEETPAGAFQHQLLQRFLKKTLKLAERVDQQVQHNLLEHHGGFRQTITDPNNWDNFRLEFHEAIRASIVEHLREMPLDELFEDVPVNELAKWMSDAAMPDALESGGATRWVVMHPERDRPNDAFVAEVQKVTEQKATAVPATVGELMACVEAECVPLDHIAMSLLKDRPDSIEYASRLHTRTDIAWTHITSMR